MRGDKRPEDAPKQVYPLLKKMPLTHRMYKGGLAYTRKKKSRGIAEPASAPHRDEKNRVSYPLPLSQSLIHLHCLSHHSLTLHPPHRSRLSLCLCFLHPPPFPLNRSHQENHQHHLMLSITILDVIVIMGLCISPRSLFDSILLPRHRLTLHSLLDGEQILIYVPLPMLLVQTT